MFDFFKNKALEVVFDELDNCINYLMRMGPKKFFEVEQVLNTIRHFIEMISNKEASVQDVQKHFTDMKTNVAFEKNLSNSQDPDYSKAYLLSTFFTCVASSHLSISKSTARKILDFCVENCSADAKPIATDLRKSYLRIFQ